MGKISLLFIFWIFSILYPTFSFSQTEQWKFSYLDSIPSLIFLNPEGQLSGSYALGKENIEITIQDCGKYAGQLCICPAAGFRIATLGIDCLFQKDEFPSRSDFYLITSKDHMVSDVVAYILGVNRRIDSTKATYFVDSSIKTKHREWHYFIIRKDDMRACHIIYVKRDLIPNKENERLKEIEGRFERGLTTAEEERYFGERMSELVEEILRGEKDHLFIIKQISYPELKRKFPYLARND